METYCNMNSYSGRNCRNQMNHGSRQREMQIRNQQNRRMQEPERRSVEVECTCKVSPSKQCHKNDPMEKLGKRFPVAMAYVPWQQWGELYEPDCALKQGTIFKELNKVFCGVRC